MSTNQIDLAEEYCLTEQQEDTVLMICQLMPDDPDGCWAMLQDYGIHIELEDLCDICGIYL